MATLLGAGNAHIASARDLLHKKGRRERGRFIFEGATLLREAVESGTSVEELYVTAEAYRESALVRELERSGIPTFLLAGRAFAKISDVESPSGIAAIAPLALAGLPAILQDPGIVLLLADLNDPGNAGTLLRSAEAFGITRVIFGNSGVDPYHPKVVRGAMGATFRLAQAVAAPADVRAAAAGWSVLGTAPGGEPIGSVAWPERTLLVVGHERAGLGAWAALCDRLTSIPMAGRAESLNAAVAGSVALYEATKRPP